MAKGDFVIIVNSMDVRNEADGAREEWAAVDPALACVEPGGMPGKSRVLLWALVLESRGIPGRIERWGLGWHLVVPPQLLTVANDELVQFEQANRNWPPPAPPPRPLAANTLPTLSILILLATFHNITRLDIAFPGIAYVDWAVLGSAHTARIMDGEWWRLVTALTLHADWFHLFSNLAIGGGFVICLCREFGSGLSWSLLLGSGILGNLVNALLQFPEHRSVGASTTVFGAVGIFAAISLVRQRSRRRWLLPVAAALALLVLLGSEGKNVDLGAHLFGFFCGFGLGLASEYMVGRYGIPGRFLNLLLAAASSLLVGGAWWAAVTLGKP
jgi:membrane associated rhomboid family serine protease